MVFVCEVYLDVIRSVPCIADNRVYIFCIYREVDTVGNRVNSGRNCIDCDRKLYLRNCRYANHTRTQSSAILLVSEPKRRLHALGTCSWSYIAFECFTKAIDVPSLYVLLYSIVPSVSRSFPSYLAFFACQFFTRVRASPTRSPFLVASDRVV